MPHLKSDFGSGMVDSKPMVRNADNTGWLDTEAYVRNDANTGWIKVWPLALSVTPSYSSRTANRGATITQSFTASGAAAGTWSFASGGAGLTIANPNSLSCSVSGTRSINTTAEAVLQFTASDGRVATAQLAWTWGSPI